MAKSTFRSFTTENRLSNIHKRVKNHTKRSKFEFLKSIYM